MLYFPLFFWSMSNLKAKIKITKSLPEFHLAPHFYGFATELFNLIFILFYFILFYFILFYFILF